MKTPRKVMATSASAIEFHRRVDDLRKIERELIEEIIVREKGGEPNEPSTAPDMEAEAFALLLGDDAPQPEEKVPVRSLKILRHEIGIVRRAIELGRQLIDRERNERQFAAMVARMDEWRALVRQTAVAALELQRLNRARRTFKLEIGGTPSLPCDLPPRSMLGCGDLVGDESYRFIREVLAQGIMTKGEVDKYA